MRTQKQYLNDIAPQAAPKNINIQILKVVKIPLPPLAEQEAIVIEISSYQKIIDGARQVVENYRPRIEVDAGVGMGGFVGGV